MREFGAIIQIGDVLVSEDVVAEYFSCDYEVCRGICCLEGDSGAPLEAGEAESICNDYPGFSGQMGVLARHTVETGGFSAVDRDGDLVTPTVPVSCECAFSHVTPEGNYMCAIEKCGFRKPMSCKLYPIRITKLTGGGLALNVHHWDICKTAFEKGKREGIRVYEFLRAPLTERFGTDFYDALEAAARHLSEEFGDDAVRDE